MFILFTTLISPTADRITALSLDSASLSKAKEEERLRTKMDEPQYCVYMYDPRKGDKPTRKDDEGIEFAYFKSEYNVDNNAMLRESIMDWDGLVIRDETDEEKAASAPQSAAKRRRRGHK